MSQAAEKTNEPLTQVELAANAVKVLGKDHAKARNTLRAAVVQARKKHSVQEIAATLGVHRQRVYQILDGQKGEK